MGYLQTSFSEVVESIRRRKVLLVLLVLLQLGLIVAFSLVVVKYQLEILESSRGVVEPLVGANYNQAQLEAGQPFLEDFLPVVRSYNALKRNLFELGGWLLFFFLIVNGLLWMGSHMLLYERKNRIVFLGKVLLRYITTGVMSLLVISLLVLILFRSSFGGLQGPDGLEPLLFKVLVGVGIMYYFFLNSVGVIGISTFKSWARKLFLVSLKRVHKTVLVLLINLVVLGIGGYLVYLGVEANSGLMLVAVLLSVVLLVLTRLYWIACLKRIAQ